jgi:hypothetical protein
MSASLSVSPSELLVDLHIAMRFRNAGSNVAQESFFQSQRDQEWLDLQDKLRAESKNGYDVFKLGSETTSVCYKPWLLARHRCEVLVGVVLRSRNNWEHLDLFDPRLFALGEATGFGVCCECKENLFDIRCRWLLEVRERGSLPNIVLESRVRNEEVSTEETFEVRVQSRKADGLSEPRLAPPKTVGPEYPAPCLALVFSPWWDVDKPFTIDGIP